MSHDGFLKNVEKLQRFGEAMSHQLTAWTEPGKQRNRVDQFWREVAEASSEIATALLTPETWRMSTEDIDRRVQHLLAGKNLSTFGTDAFGYSPLHVRKLVPVLEFLYRVYFRAEVHGMERVPEGRCLLIANHSGQLPFDGAMIGSALLLERNPPIMVRTMVEKFATALPFFGELCYRCGQVTGLPDNCRRLLDADEAVLVFPEGARGISKPFKDRYHMTAFGHGFLRLALQTHAPIVPIAVVGAEEQTINIYDFKWLAHMLGTPSLAITPLMPLLGPLAMLPAPVKYRIYFGEPMHFEGDANDDEAVMATRVAEVKGAIQRLMNQGLAERKGIFI